MDLQEFEHLWSMRGNQRPEILDMLEKQRQSCPQCRAYASGGNQIRSILQELGNLHAPDNFAYRMRVYAGNHKDDKPSFLDVPVLRWSSLALGVTTGAALFFFTVGSLNQPSKMTLQESIELNNSPSQPVAATLNDSAAENRVDLAEGLDDSTSPTNQQEWGGSPIWKTSTVSTER